MSEQLNATELKIGRIDAAKRIPVNLIKENENNCRIGKALKNIPELAESIRQIGQIESLIVIANNEGTYNLVAGSRRLAAIKLNQELLGEPQFANCEVKAAKRLSDVDIYTITLTENIQRENLSCIEEANGVKFLANTGLNQTQIGAKLGKCQVWVSQRSILGSLNYDLQMKIHEGEINMTDGLKLANQSREEQKETSAAIDAAKAEIIPPAVSEPTPVLNDEGDVVGVTMQNEEPTPEQKKAATQAAKAKAREIARNTTNPNARKKNDVPVPEGNGRPESSEILDVVKRAISSPKVDDDTKTVLKVLALYVEGTIRDEDDFIISFNEAVLSVKPEEKTVGAAA